MTGATGATAAETRSAVAANGATPSTLFGDSADPQDESSFACGDLLVIGARGSGENAGLVNNHDEYGFGKMVGRAVDRLHDVLDSSRSVRYVALDYPALATSVLTDDLSLLNTSSLAWGGQSAYLASIDEGAVEMRRLLQQSATSCPDERWILVGYSQGALVIDEALSPWQDARRFAGIIRVADPGRTVSQAAANLGTASAGNGISTVTASQVNPFPYTDDSSVVIDLCDKRDLVCDTSNWIAGVVASAPPGVSAALTPAAIDAGIEVHEGYSEARIDALVDAILPRIRSLPVPSQRHMTVTRCGPEVGGNGLATITDKATVVPRPAGASPVAWSGGYYSAGDGTSFSVQDDGSWAASLKPGHYSIPITATASGWLPVHAWLDVSISLSCEEMYTCGPEHPAPTTGLAWGSNAWGHLARPPSEYDDTIVVGRVVCPGGLPAVGAAVAYCPEQEVACRGFWVTDARGYYRIPIGNDVDDGNVWINVYLAGYPAMIGGNPRAATYEPSAALYVPEKGTVNAPTAQFTRFATITVRTAIEKSPWFTGNPESQELSGSIITADDDTDQAASRLEFSSSLRGSREFCLRYDGHNCSGNPGDPFYRGDTVTLRVLPGTHYLRWATGGTAYDEWWGSSDVDLCGFWRPDEARCAGGVGDRVPASAQPITVAPGEHLDLGVKTLSHMSFVAGVVRDVQGAGVAQLPVNTYRYLHGQWLFTDEGDWESARIQGDFSSQTRWSFGALPGLHRIVINDPQSEHYDPAYETLYYPGVRTFAAAAPIQIDRGVRILDLETEYPAQKSTAAAGRGTVSGTVTDSSGAPLSGMVVSLNGPDYGFGLTDVLGRYAISGLPAGSYTAYTHDGKGHEQWWKGANSESASTPVTVASGVDRTSVDFSLDVTATVPQRFFAVSPRITGTAEVGRTLIANPDLTMWSPEPTSVTYQWLRFGMPIAGATGPTLNLTADDLDTCVSVRVTGGKPGWESASRESGCVMVMGAGIVGSVPTIRGTAKVGSTLTAQPGSWSSDATLSFRWYRGSTAISGATASAYKLTAADSGQKVAVKVTGSREGAASLSKRSTAVTVAAGTLNATKPVMSGTVAVGSKLTVKRGTWSSGTSFTYRWYANGSAISKATSSSFTLAKAQAGKKISVKVTGTKEGYTTLSLTSSATAKVMTASNPTISGTTVVGKKLTAKTGAWTSGTIFSYQWYASGKAISKATKSTLALSSSLRGKTITVKVIGKKSGYATVTKPSKATARVR